MSFSGLEVVGLVSDSIEDYIDPEDKTPPPANTIINRFRLPYFGGHANPPAQEPTATSKTTSSETTTTEGTEHTEHAEGEVSHTQAVLEELEKDPNYANAEPDEPASQAAEERPDVIPVAVKV
jgi:hypothetical protein